MLWFDLMFDVQVWRHRADSVPEDVLASIAAYYGRVTTRARPMNRLIGLVMLGALTALAVELIQGDSPRWVAVASLVLTGTAVTLAASHTFGAAVRLGTRRDPAAEQGRLARAILRDHVICFPAIAAVIALQLAFA